LDWLIHRGGAFQIAPVRLADGTRLDYPALVAHATVLKARGFDALPTCNNYDQQGHCLGCESEGL
jgi:hypothetical protein